MNDLKIGDYVFRYTGIGNKTIHKEVIVGETEKCWKVGDLGLIKIFKDGLIERGGRCRVQYYPMNKEMEARLETQEKVFKAKSHVYRVSEKLAHLDHSQMNSEQASVFEAIAKRMEELFIEVGVLK